MPLTKQRFLEAAIVLTLICLLVGLLLPNLGSARRTDRRATAVPNSRMADESAPADQVFQDSSRQVARFSSPSAGAPLTFASVAQAADTPPRMITRSADLTVRVDDVGAFIADASALVEQRGGFVAEASHTPGDGRRDTGTLRLAVPADALTETLEALRGMAAEIESDAIKAQDVTDSVFDLEARLTNLRTAEERMRAILNEIKAQEGAASAVIEIFRELTDLREQIERLEAQRRNTLQRVQYASVAVRVHGPDAAQPKVAEPGMGPAQTWHYAVDTLQSTLRQLLNGAIFIGVALLPVVALFAVPIAAIAWLVRRRWPQTRQAHAATDDIPTAPGGSV